MKRLPPVRVWNAIVTAPLPPRFAPAAAIAPTKLALSGVGTDVLNGLGSWMDLASSHIHDGRYYTKTNLQTAGQADLNAANITTGTLQDKLKAIYLNPTSSMTRGGNSCQPAYTYHAVGTSGNQP